MLHGAAIRMADLKSIVYTPRILVHVCVHMYNEILNGSTEYEEQQTYKALNLRKEGEGRKEERKKERKEGRERSQTTERSNQFEEACPENLCTGVPGEERTDDCL